MSASKPGLEQDTGEPGAWASFQRYGDLELDPLTFKT